MKKVKVEVCFGTTCHVMGGSELLEIEKFLSDDINPYVDLCGVGCLDCCKDQNFGKAPFIRLDGKILGSMTVEKLVALITQRVKEVNQL